MANKTDNYCQLLGLDPFNEGKYTLDKINEKIDKMEVKWANEFRNKQNDTGQRFKYHKLVEEVPEIRRSMADPLRRANVFKEGRTALEGKCQRLKLDCVILTDGRYVILPGFLDNFVKRLHWDGIDKKLVLKLAGITDGTVPKIVSDKVVNAYTNLTTVDAYTPIDILNVLIANQDLEIRCSPLSEGSSLSQIRSAFELCEKRVNSVRQELLPDQDSYISVLRSLKLIISSDKEYADLVNYGKCNRALIPVMEMIEKEYTGHQISRAYIDELLNIHINGRDTSRDSKVDRGLDQEMCLSILQSFCHKKRIAANFSKLDSTMIRCPVCNNMVPGGNNTMYCPYCGKNFKTVCPQCSTPQLSSNIVCIKCGYNFKDGETKAQNYALSFRMDIQKGNITKAEKDLTSLKEVYSTFAGIAGMEVQLRKEQGALNTLKNMINVSHKANKFYAVKNAGDAMLAKYPMELQNYPDIKQKYDDAVHRVQNADVFCQRAQAAQSKNEMLSLYVSAAEQCPDHPTARGVLEQSPPAGPIDPVGIIQKNSLIIKYKPPMDNREVTYVIYRSKNTLPNITEETRPLAEIPGNVYTDKTMEPGVEYYYSVYSKRWGIQSREAAHYGPIILLAEVENVRIEQIDGGLRLMYEKPRGATRVRVWRGDTTTGTNVELALNGETVYDDVGLTGGQKYHYLFVAEYETRNRIERSQGSMFSETPLDAPKPVNDMGVLWNKNDGTFTARWKSRSPVKLFYSEKKYNIAGNMVKMEDIRSWMKEVEVLQDYEDGARFALPDGTVQYIYPIIELGKMGIKGTEVMVANLKPFRDVDKTLSNKDCIITMIWPDNVIAAKLVISTNGVKDLNDPTAEILTVSREEYEDEKLIRIPMGKAPKKTINIFAMYKIGNEIISSNGLCIDVFSADCKKVRYKIDGGKKAAVLEINTSMDVTSIPPVALVRVDAGIPLRKSDGEILWSSGGPIQLTGGSAKVPMTLKGHSDLDHMRIFFEDESDYNLFRFIHPLPNRRD